MRITIPLFLAFCMVFSLVFTALVDLDIWMNHWLYQAANDWHWWNYFTTKHAVSMLYIKYGWRGLLAPIAVLSLLSSVMMLARR
jgi:hypothetical protein